MLIRLVRTAYAWEYIECRFGRYDGRKSAVTRHILDTFAQVETLEAQGYTFPYCGAERKLPFATLATADNPYDSASRLDRPSAYRLNIGVSKDTYGTLFGPPSRSCLRGAVRSGCHRP